MLPIPSSVAIEHACIGPAPPKETSAKRRGSWPRATETTRKARTIVAFAILTIAAAASSTPKPSGLATWSSIARRAADASSPMRPPRKRAGSSVPRTSCASVTVASSPPRP